MDAEISYGVGAIIAQAIKKVEKLGLELDYEIRCLCYMRDLLSYVIEQKKLEYGSK